MSYDENNLAENYYQKRNPKHPLRKVVYETWLAECDVRGKNILDLGCGAGESSRKLALAGAKVLGIDNSKKMLAEARRLEKEKLQGIKYEFGNIVELKKFPKKFDLISACYILHYFRSDELAEVIIKIARNLKDGGKLVAINQDPVTPVWHMQDDGKGLVYPYTEKWLDEPSELDSRVLIEWYDAEGKKYGEAINYFINKSVWENILSETGFCEIQWTTPKPKDTQWKNIPTCITVFSAVKNGSYRI